MAMPKVHHLTGHDRCVSRLTDVLATSNGIRAVSATSPWGRCQWLGAGVGCAGSRPTV